MSGIISVRVVGARLWRQAIERLVASLLGVHPVADDGPWAPGQVTILLGLASSEVQTHLRKHGASRCVLITNDHDMRQPAFRQVEISVFVGEQEDATILHESLRQAAQNLPFCSPSLIPALINVAQYYKGTAPEIVLTAPAAAVPLSTREREVVGYALEGWANEQIATHLHVSLSTVKFHLFNAYRKLGVSRRSQLRGALARQNDPAALPTKPKL